MMVVMPTQKLRLDQDQATGIYYTRWTGDDRRRHKRTFGSNVGHARIRFDEFYARWKVDSSVRNPSVDGPVTCQQLWDRFDEYAQGYYRRRDGTPTREATNLMHAFRHVLTLHGSLPANEFNAVTLKAVQQSMIAADLCRNVVNQRVRKIRQIFRWAHGEQLVNAEVIVSVESVKAIKAFRTKARETGGVESVGDKLIDKTIEQCPPTLAAMIRVQRLTGMRPAEVCILRVCDIDMAGPVWLYRPHQHKLLHYDQDRTIAMGPRVQAVIEPLIGRGIGTYLFSPASARREREVTSARALGRKCARKTDRRVGEHYTPQSYYRAIQYACRRGNLPEWSPNQLRHTWATEARRRGQLDAAQSQLGHSDRATTEGYAHLVTADAIEYQRQYG